MKKSSKKRRFSELRYTILAALSDDQKTLNQIASETGINWKTVDNHITFLIGKGLVKEVFSSRYVRIVEITEKGSEQLQKGSKITSRKAKSKFEQKGEVKI